MNPWDYADEGEDACPDCGARWDRICEPDCEYFYQPMTAEDAVELASEAMPPGMKEMEAA